MDVWKLMKAITKESQFQNQVFQNPSRVLVKIAISWSWHACLDEDDQEVEPFDLDEGMDRRCHPL